MHAQLRMHAALMASLAAALRLHARQKAGATAKHAFEPAASSQQAAAADQRSQSGQPGAAWIGTAREPAAGV